MSDGNFEDKSCFFGTREISRTKAQIRIGTDKVYVGITYIQYKAIFKRKTQKVKGNIGLSIACLFYISESWHVRRSSR